MSVTRNDVARMADVSPAVVSYVLNAGPRPVSAAARKRVLDAVAALGYLPDGRARSLRTRTSNTLGLIVPDAANPFFAELARAVEDAAFAAGKSVLVCNSVDDVERERVYLDALVEKRVDGIILAAASGSEDLADVLAVGIPIVAMDRYRIDAPIATVRFNDRSAGHLAGSHLLAHGRGRLAMIGGPAGLRVSVERSEGVREAGVDLRSERPGPFDYAGGRDATLELLEHDPAIDGLVCASDVQAVGALAALRALGRRVPQEVAVVSIDGTGIGAFTAPSLTSVCQPVQSMSALAVGALVGSAPLGQVTLEGELIARESCGCEDA